MGFLPDIVGGDGGKLGCRRPRASTTMPTFGLLINKEFRSSERHKIVIDWLKKIFDPKTYPCFRDEFIHPNDLVPLMAGPRAKFRTGRVYSCQNRSGRCKGAALIGASALRQSAVLPLSTRRPSVP